MDEKEQDPAAPMRQVSVEEQRDALLKAFLVGPARALDLFRRVPPEMRKRGWPEDHDSKAILIAAIGAYKLGARGQRFSLSPALLAHADWFKLAVLSTRDAMDPNAKLTVSAAEIVEGFDLDELCVPA